MSETGIELGVDGTLDAVMTRLDAGEPRVWVTGDIGSGRSTLGQRLVDELDTFGRKSVFVQLAERDEPDAAISGYYGLARRLPTEGKRRECWRDWPRFSQAVHALDEAADDEREWTWILNVPSSWEARRIDSDWDALSQRRCHDFLRSLVRGKQRIVWLTGHTMQPDILAADEELQAIPLPRPKNATALFRSVDWGSYQPAADRLASVTPEDSVISPIVLRLGVGVVHFGEDPNAVADKLGSSAAANGIRPLAEVLFERIRFHARDLFDPIYRLLEARTSLQRDELLKITSIPDDHLTLLTQCLGYGSNEVRVSSSLRAHLRKLLRSHRNDDAHSRLAEYYESLDGKSEIAKTYGDETTAWLEKTFHRLQTQGTADLKLLPCREMYWARGRYLSRRLRRYEEAARVYEKCSERFPDDDYAHHYWAFNLARAGQERETVEAQYQRAIELFREHPWWNSRLVTFLIEQGRPRAAEAAWTQALDNVDPDGDRLISNPDLADQLHYWVGSAWLEAGNVAAAMSVLRGIPEDVIFRSSKLPRLKQQILAAAEADALGFAVYPEGIPMEERWERPLILDLAEGEKWWPGAVVLASKEFVRIGYGQKTPDGLKSFSIEVDEKTWRAQTKSAPDKAFGFVELAKGSDGELKIKVVPERPVPSDERREGSTFPFLDRWRSQTLSA